MKHFFDSPNLPHLPHIMSGVESDVYFAPASGGDFGQRLWVGNEYTGFEAMTGLSPEVALAFGGFPLKPPKSSRYD